MDAMVRYLHGATLVLTVFATIVFAATNQEFTPSPEGGNVAISVTSPEPGNSRLIYSFPEIDTRTVTAEGEDYSEVGIPGESHTSEIGRPELPMVNRVVGIPDFGAVRVRVVSADYTETQGVRIYPMQPWEEENQNNTERPFTRDAEFYRTNTWYPEQIATISEPAVMRDVRIAVVSICPVQYNPATGTVRTYSNIEVVVEPTGEPGINEKTHSFPHPSSLFMPLYRELVNFDELELDETPNTPGTLLIICADNQTVLTQVNLLANWKRRKGTPTTVATRTQTGSSSSQIYSYIQNFYNNSNPPLEYILLIGDDNSSGEPFHVPAYTSGYSGTDFPYTLLAGGDGIGDVAIGRLSCSTSTELQVIVNKSIRYERNPYMGQTSWYTRAYSLAGVSHTCASNITTLEWVRSQMRRNGYTQTPMDTHNGSVNVSQMQTQINPGCTIFNWRGGWISEMPTSAPNGLTNGWMLPEVTLFTCGTGDFSGAGAGLTEAWLRYGTLTNGNAALGATGTATSGTHVNFNNMIDAGIYHGYFVAGYRAPGMALLEGKFQLYRNYWPQESSYVTNYFNWVNLMGDPELKMWTAVPQSLAVSHPSSLALGCNQIECHVNNASAQPEEGVLVTALGTNTYSRGFTNANGDVVLPLTLPTTDSLYITTFKLNCLYYQAQVPVIQQALWVSVDSFTVDDDNSGGTSGNGDGILNPNELVDIRIRLHNYGSSQTATSVTGVLSSLDLTTAQVQTTTQNFPNIPPGGNGFSTGAYRVRVVATAQDQAMVRLLLEVTASGNDQTSLIELPVISGHLVYTNHQFTGSNNRLDPGETETMVVTLSNVGHSNVSGAQGVVFSNNNFISFPNPNATFGLINQGSSGNNSSNPFTISANPMTFPGSRARIGLALTGNNSFYDTTYYDISIGLINMRDPTGPDEYGYYCFDNTDTSYEMCPEYNWLEIDPSHAGSGSWLPLNDQMEDQDQSCWITLPFTFKMYGIESDTLTVCTNGWCALGHQTQFNDFRNWHMPGPFGPDLMISAFWDDLITSTGHVCSYYDATNGWFIVEWSGVKTLYGSHTEAFEIILYDPDVWLTFTGDGMIKFQYQTVYNGQSGNNDNDYATVGIENDVHDVGLEVTYWNSYSPGAATLSAGRAYLFTNMVEFRVGSLAGTVTDAATGLPVSGAMVSCENGSYWDTTDASGYYILPEVLVNEYDVSCSKLGYNTGVATVTILENDTISQNFNLLHPEFQLDVSEITATLSQGDSVHRTFHLNNTGNGPLDYSLDMDFHLSGLLNHGTPSTGPVRRTNETDDPWDELLNINVSAATGDLLFQGVAFAWGSFWAVGGGTTSNPTNMIYQFDRNGNYLGPIPQPSTTTLGFRDLAFDGDLLWGSEDANIVGFDTLGAVHETIPGPLNPNRCLTYDPTENVFYVGDLTAAITVIDRQGNIIRQYSGHGLRAYGLAWFRDDPDGYPLYIFCSQSGTGGIYLHKMDPQSGTFRFVTQLQGEPSDRSGGAEITPYWNPLFYVLVGQIMGSSADKIGVWEIAPNTAWITYSPQSGTVPAGGQQAFDVFLDAREMSLGDYGVNLVFSHNAISQHDTIRVHLTVVESVVEPEETPIPFTYSLGQNYPNPFNPTTSIPYTLRDQVYVRLEVYNILGQRVARLVDEVQTPGAHRAILGTEALASGIYFYRLEAGPFNMTRKMVILK